MTFPLICSPDVCSIIYSLIFFLSEQGNAHCSSRASQWVSGTQNLLRTDARLSLPTARQGGGMSTLRMSLFGLGWGELAVIGAIAAIIFGPKNLAGLGKDLGKIAGTLKSEVDADTFPAELSSASVHARFFF
jgi:sec-independent protein translocase protein TatA